MKIGLLFPGQGSQFIGMGSDFARNFTSANQVFTNLDDILGRKLSKLIFEGGLPELSLTTNSQPAIMASSVAILESIKENQLLNFDNVTAVAGHSLGEYSALVAAESLSFKSAVELLNVRSRAMQDSMPIGTGGMAAVIGKSINEIVEILPELREQGRIYIANDNADGQIVLSGELKSIKFICENSKKFGLKRVLELPVSAPFHCELIKNASQKLKVAIDEHSFNKFQFDFYSNVTSKKCSHVEIKKLLVEQVVSRVRWRESVENMIKDKISCFIEIGPGNILTNLIKRIDKNVMAITISKVEDLDKLKTIG